MKKVSIIVPIYNVEEYLPTCIMSVFAQTLTEYELILVDDESPDGCPELCDKYAAMDSRVKVVHKKNGGLAAARESGFRASSGEYIFCLDADDCIHPDTLRDLYTIAAQEHLPLVQCTYQEIAQEDRSNTYALHPGATHMLTPYEAYHLLEEDQPGYGDNARLAMIVAWSKLIRRDVWERMQGFPLLRIHEDQMMVSHLLANIDRMAFVETDYYFYRKRKGSIMNSGWKKEKLVILDIYKERLRVVSELQNVAPEEGKKLQDFMLRRYLIAIFRNYIQVRTYLEGKERKALCATLVTRFRREKAAHKELHLNRGDALLFRLFTICPSLCATLYAYLKRDA